MQVVKEIYEQTQTCLPNELMDYILRLRRKAFIRDMLARYRTVWSNKLHHIYGKKYYHIVTDTVEHGYQALDIETHVFRFHNCSNYRRMAAFYLSSLHRECLVIEFQLEGYTMKLKPNNVRSVDTRGWDIFIIPHEGIKKQITCDCYAENPVYVRMRYVWRHLLYFLFLVRHKIQMLNKQDWAYACLHDTVSNFLYAFVFFTDVALARAQIICVDNVAVESAELKRMFEQISLLFKEAYMSSDTPMFTLCMHLDGWPPNRVQ